MTPQDVVAENRLRIELDFLGHGEVAPTGPVTANEDRRI